MNKINFCNLFSSHISFLGAPEEKYTSFKITVVSNTRHDYWFEDDVDHLKKRRLPWQ